MPAPAEQRDDPPMPQHATTPTEPAEPHPTGADLQKIMVFYGMALFTMVVGTALYGPPEKSERAFRLLHWWKRDSEPTPAAQRRARK